MKDYQKRIVNEKKELDIRLKKLNEFLANSNVVISKTELLRLEKQSEIMIEYSKILKNRIESF